MNKQTNKQTNKNSSQTVKDSVSFQKTSHSMCIPMWFFTLQPVSYWLTCVWDGEEEADTFYEHSRKINTC